MNDNSITVRCSYRHQFTIRYNIYTITTENIFIHSKWKLVKEKNTLCQLRILEMINFVVCIMHTIYQQCKAGYGYDRYNSPTATEEIMHKRFNFNGPSVSDNKFSVIPVAILFGLFHRSKISRFWFALSAPGNNQSLRLITLNQTVNKLTRWINVWLIDLSTLHDLSPN